MRGRLRGRRNISALYPVPCTPRAVWFGMSLPTLTAGADPTLQSQLALR